MGIGEVLTRGGLGVAVGTVFRVDEVTRSICWEVEVKNNVGDIANDTGLRVGIREFIKVADEDGEGFW
jgi:hypothetical protein